jgi:hypothetical protein
MVMLLLIHNHLVHMVLATHGVPFHCPVCSLAACVFNARIGGRCGDPGEIDPLFAGKMPPSDVIGSERLRVMPRPGPPPANPLNTEGERSPHGDGTTPTLADEHLTD